jgi:hypothetical protein
MMVFPDRKVRSLVPKYGWHYLRGWESGSSKGGGVGKEEARDGRTP